MVILFFFRGNEGRVFYVFNFIIESKGFVYSKRKINVIFFNSLKNINRVLRYL